MDISLKDLEAAFAKLPVEVSTTIDVFTSSGTQIHTFRYPASNPEGTARRFFDHLRVHRETSERDPWSHEDDEVVDAHVCCEHANGPYATRASYELRLVDQIVALLGHRGERVTRRVLRWVWDYLTDDDEPPF